MVNTGSLPEKPLLERKLAWLQALFFFFAISRKSSILKLSTLQLVSSQAPSNFLAFCPSPVSVFSRKPLPVPLLLVQGGCHHCQPPPWWAMLFATCPCSWFSVERGSLTPLRCGQLFPSVREKKPSNAIKAINKTNNIWFLKGVYKSNLNIK